MFKREDRADHLRFSYVVALLMWTFLAFKTLYDYFQAGEFFALYMNKHPFLIDFPLYYSAGLLAKMAMHSPTNIYDIHLQDTVLRGVIAPVVPELPWFIQAPPPVFLCAAILPLMSLPVAWGVFCLLGDLLVFISLYMLLKEDLPSKKDFGFIALGTVSCFPFWICNRMGQLALFAIPTAIMFWRALRSKRPGLAGLFSALLIMKFQYLPFLGVTGLALGKVRYFLVALASAVAILGVSGLALGWPNVLSYPQTVMHGEFDTSLYSGVAPQDQQNVRSLLVRLTGSDSHLVNQFCIALCLLVAAVIFFIWLKGLKNLPPENRFKFLSTLTCVCMLVFSPHCHTQDYLILIVPCAWIWIASLRSSGPPSRWARYFVICLPLLTWVLFILDKLLPLPAFACLTPFIVAASWASFCTPAALAPTPSEATAAALADQNIE